MTEIHNSPTDRLILPDQEGNTTGAFRVRAVDRSGNKSKWSEKATATTGGTFAQEIAELGFPASILTGQIVETQIAAHAVAARHLVADKAVITGSAQIAEAIIDDAHIVDLDAAKIRAGTMLAGSVRVGGQSLGAISSASADPARAINQTQTTIDPGKIEISGGTTLADWRHGGDETKIDGGELATNTVRAESIVAGSRGIAIEGLSFTAKAPPTVEWTGGSMTYVDDAGHSKTISVDQGSATPSDASASNPYYFYWIKDDTVVHGTFGKADAFCDDRVVLADYNGGERITDHYGRTTIDGDHIETGTVKAKHADIDNFKSRILTANCIKSGMIDAGAVTADKMKVTSLEAISANLGSVKVGVGNFDKIMLDGHWLEADSITKLYMDESFVEPRERGRDIDTIIIKRCLYDIKSNEKLFINLAWNLSFRGGHSGYAEFSIPNLFRQKFEFSGVTISGETNHSTEHTDYKTEWSYSNTNNFVSTIYRFSNQYSYVDLVLSFKSVDTAFYSIDNNGTYLNVIRCTK